MAEDAVDTGVGQTTDVPRSQEAAAAGSDRGVATGDVVARGSGDEPGAVAGGRGAASERAPSESARGRESSQQPGGRESSEAARSRRESGSRRRSRRDARSEAATEHRGEPLAPPEPAPTSDGAASRPEGSSRAEGPSEGSSRVEGPPEGSVAGVRERYPEVARALENAGAQAREAQLRREARRGSGWRRSRRGWRRRPRTTRRGSTSSGRTPRRTLPRN